MFLAIWRYRESSPYMRKEPKLHDTWLGPVWTMTIRFPTAAGKDEWTLAAALPTARKGMGPTISKNGN